ncbi:hypothetical protein F5883DRAFT_566962 [Diaporthe sp. PMI_573]|nr:hypothetical protein F5883DRAFT_584221 [Diaporthaceae sp. PMI_573]KAH8757944.1 hypothetical protein F5883DRAFT_566867 [Diaporthaceae sp. PMI_573]KAH8757971.1 hypothetical protein F5883DRAFT_566962 [Diaporthaceae sp. PMI_573]
MPSGRLPKRPGDLGESQDNSFGTQKAKLPRLERGFEDFSQVVKDRLQSYIRTGQACDRCKVRRPYCPAPLLIPLQVDLRLLFENSKWVEVSSVSNSTPVLAAWNRDVTIIVDACRQKRLWPLLQITMQTDAWSS